MRMGPACRSATLVLVLLCVFGGGKAQNEEAEFLMDTADSASGDYLRKVLLDIENEPAAGLKKLIRFLRSGDTRLVIVKPSPEFKGKQRQFHAARGIPDILKLLDPASPEIEVRTRAAEALHLLALENPPLSQQIGLHAWIPGSFGLPELLGMVTAGCGPDAKEGGVRAAEEAGEAVWALVVSSVENLEMAADKGVDALAHAVVSGGSARLRMWAAASLKRLVFDFYDTVDGSYASRARRIRNNHHTRVRLSQDAGLVDALLEMVRERRVKETTPRGEWPTHAPFTARNSLSIEAWAAAGALAALAGSEEVAKVLTDREAGPALCSLRSSPDALERVEADAAIIALEFEGCPHQQKPEL